MKIFIDGKEDPILPTYCPDYTALISMPGIFITKTTDSDIIIHKREEIEQDPIKEPLILIRQDDDGTERTYIIQKTIEEITYGKPIKEEELWDYYPQAIDMWKYTSIEELRTYPLQTRHEKWSAEMMEKTEEYMKKHGFKTDPKKRLELTKPKTSKLMEQILKKGPNGVQKIYEEAIEIYRDTLLSHNYSNTHLS